MYSDDDEAEVQVRRPAKKKRALGESSDEDADMGGSVASSNRKLNTPPNNQNGSRPLDSGLSSASLRLGSDLLDTPNEGKSNLSRIKQRKTPLSAKANANKAALSRTHSLLKERYDELVKKTAGGKVHQLKIAEEARNEREAVTSAQNALKKASSVQGGSSSSTSRQFAIPEDVRKNAVGGKLKSSLNNPTGNGINVRGSAPPAPANGNFRTQTARQKDANIVPGHLQRKSAPANNKKKPAQNKRRNDDDSDFVPDDETSDSHFDSGSDDVDERAERQQMRAIKQAENDRKAQAAEKSAWDKMKEVAKVTIHTVAKQFARNMTQSALQEMRRKINKGRSSIVENVRDELKDTPVACYHKLKEYQKVGVRWMKTLTDMGYGCILADEMGLGKTAQVLSFISIQRSEPEGDEARKPVLVVAPVSLLHNWENEVSKWTDLKCFRYHDSQLAARQEKANLYFQNMNEYDIVLTTSHVICNREDRKFFFQQIAFSYFITDEAHSLKTSGTQRAKSMNKINADRRILLTGTPIQNSLAELCNLLWFTMPKEFAHLQTIADDDISKDTRGGYKRERAARLQFLQNMSSGFLLRRLKSDVLKDLPPKECLCYFAELDQQQKELYQAEIDSCELHATYDPRSNKMRLQGGINKFLIENKRNLDLNKVGKVDAGGKHAKALSALLKQGRAEGNNDPAESNDPESSKEVPVINGVKGLRGSPTPSPEESAESSNPASRKNSDDLDPSPTASASESPDESNSASAVQNLTLMERRKLREKRGQNGPKRGFGTMPKNDNLTGGLPQGHTTVSANQKNAKTQSFKNLFWRLRRITNGPLMAQTKLSHEHYVELSEKLVFHTQEWRKQGLNQTLKLLKEKSDFEIHEEAKKVNLTEQPYAATEEEILAGGKIQTLMKIMKKRGKEKTVIFSQYTQYMNVIGEALAIKGYSFIRLDGSTPTEERQSLCKEFEDPQGPQVFLLSTRAGGVGLNLVIADTCILMDMDYNPQNNRQAEDRVHRIGQTRPTKIIYILSKNTIEDKILEINVRKMKLDANFGGEQKNTIVDAKAREAGTPGKPLKPGLSPGAPADNEEKDPIPEEDFERDAQDELKNSVFSSTAHEDVVKNAAGVMKVLELDDD